MAKIALFAVLSVAFIAPNGLATQTSASVKKIQMDWKAFSASRISGNAPVYPPLATATRIEGAVRLDLTVATDGSVKDWVVLSGHPLLVQSAIDAVKTWRFKPATDDGVMVEVETVAPVLFFLQGHDVSTALAPFRKNVEKHPKDPKEYIALGRELANYGEPREAADVFREAISLQPQDPGAYFHLGQALTAEGDLDGAVAEYRKGISIDSKIAYAHFDLGSCLIRKGDLNGAIAEYRLGLQLQPKEADRHDQMGILLLKKQDFEGAAVEFELALRYGMDIPFVHFNLGRTFEGKGDLAAAAKEYERALKEMPKNEEFREALKRVTKQSSP